MIYLFLPFLLLLIVVAIFSRRRSSVRSGVSGEDEAIDQQMVRFNARFGDAVKDEFEKPKYR